MKESTSSLDINNQITAILKAICWDSFTPSQLSVIFEIIKCDDSPISKAGEICDFLGIDRRGNRSAISQVIASQK